MGLPPRQMAKKISNRGLPDPSAGVPGIYVWVRSNTSGTASSGGGPAVWRINPRGLPERGSGGKGFYPKKIQHRRPRWARISDDQSAFPTHSSAGIDHNRLGAIVRDQRFSVWPFWGSTLTK
ncbi:MAG: hypothetical protein CM15mP74_05170 [Halieaceae bacterium]|nr:MAG: hypothetical protein CM15mP74_05170 [Halieaceae bacterium]